MTRGALLRIYRTLHQAYGDQHWWPGETDFEVMVGAVLTQNTSWTNVERAIANLKAHDALAAEMIVGLPHAELAALLKPSGYFNIKAKRLVNYCRWYLQAGGTRRLRRRATDRLRGELLGVNGIGPETADDILLYAFARPVFVIDAYTRRLGRRLGWYDGDETYESLRVGFENALGADVALFNEYHALIVRHAKEVCKPRPLCQACCLGRLCPRASL
jgi:endonuclease-3 related protein